MTYGYCRDAALKLLNQYSIGGSVIAPSYNNQCDYFKRMPELINDAVLLVALTAAPLEAAFAPSSTTALGGGWVCFALPEDCVRLTGRGLTRATAAGLELVGDYRRLGPRRLALRSELLAGLSVAYVRAPTKIAYDSPEDTALDLPDWAASPVPYYVAAHLAAGEDSFLYAALLGRFEELLERLKAPPESEAGAVADEYGLDSIY